jgi:hypothetical protein
VQKQIEDAKEADLYNAVFSTSYTRFSKEAQEFYSTEKSKKEQQEDKNKAAETKNNAPSEWALTKAVHDELSQIIGAGEKFEAVHQHTLWYKRGIDEEKRCHVDLLLRRNGDKSTEMPVLLLVEVGFNCDWWQKAHQNASYIENSLDNSRNTSTVFSNAMLFGVLTINIKQGKGEPKFKDPTFLSAQLGIFLCTRAQAPSSSNAKDSFRMSLLWRNKICNLRETSEAIGKMLRAACLLPKILDEVEQETYDFVYLGPSCCRRGNRVRICNVRVCALSGGAPELVVSCHFNAFSQTGVPGVRHSLPLHPPPSRPVPS